MSTIECSKGGGLLATGQLSISSPNHHHYHHTKEFVDSLMREIASLFPPISSQMYWGEGEKMNECPLDKIFTTIE